jgi:YesN/AraC family two-component response regulator
MYKVLVVDDELLIRKRIILGFDWESLGYQATAEAADGQEALRLMEAQGFDLAIVDIAMPGMGGIELVKEIRRRRIPLEIIFLTGHSDFKYAKEALAEGVFSYILKPLDEEEFTSALTRLSEKMTLERQRARQIDALRKTDLAARRIVASKFFSRLFHFACANEQEAARALDAYGLHAERWHTVAVLRGEEDLLSEEPFRQRLEPLEAMLAALPEGPGARIATFDLYENALAVVFELPDADGPGPAAPQIEGAAALTAALFQGLPGDRAGLGGAFRGVAGIRQAYRQALDALNNTLLTGARLARFDALESRRACVYGLSASQEKELRGLVDGGAAGEAAALVGAHLDAAVRAGVLFDGFRALCLRIEALLGEALIGGPVGIKAFLGDYGSLDTMFLFRHDLADVKGWMCELARSVTESMDMRRRGKPLEIVSRSQHYLQAHFQESDLSLTRMAEDLGVTPAYLSTVFKKAAGMSVTQHIAMLRLEKAREMIKSSRLDIREVAERVGFNDEFYFSRCFKKYFGTPPSSVLRLRGQSGQD